VLEEAVAASPLGAVGGIVSVPAGVVVEEVLEKLLRLPACVGGAHAVAIRGGCGQAGVRESVAPVVVPICANEAQLAPVQRSMR